MSRRFADLPVRAGITLVGAPLGLLFFRWASSWAFTALLVIVAWIAARELERLLRGPKDPAAGRRISPWPFLAAGLVASGAVTPLVPFWGQGVMVAAQGTVLVGLGLLARAWIRGPARPPRRWVPALVLAMGGLLPACLVAMRCWEGDDGEGYAMTLLAAAWGADIGGYLVGRAFGRHRLAPRLSRHKTIEGALAGTALGTLAAVGAYGLFLMEALPPGFVAEVAPAAARIFLPLPLLAQAGDLLESAAKRAAGAEHSGQVLPEEGGMLDIVDGLWLSAPFLAGSFIRGG